MEGLYRNNRTFFNVHDETWTALAIWAIIGFPGITYNVNRILNFVLENPTIWDTLIIEMLSATFILLGTMTALKKLQRREFLLIVFIGMSWFVSYLLNEECRKLLTGSYFSPVLIYGPIGILCIAHFKDWRKFQKVGVPFIIIGSISFFVTSYMNVNGDINSVEELNYMAFSYNNLIYVIAAFWIAIHRKNICFWLIAPPAMITLMITGSRGAILCVLVYLLLEILLSKKTHVVIKLLFVAIAALVYFNIEFIMLQFDEVLKGYGYQSRTIAKFFEGTLQDDSGRGDIIKYSFEALWERPVTGYGVAGSMPVLFEKLNGMKAMGTQGIYSHNLFLEIALHFGVFLGGFICIWLVYHVVRSYFRSRNKDAYNVLFLFAALVLPKLAVTGTYLAETNFFILLGLLLNLSYENYEELPQATE